MADPLVPPPLGEMPLGALLASISARTATPGGGAAAALCAALGCAAGAMAARYTTGTKWQDREAAASAIAENLDLASREFLALADADAQAFAAVTQARKAQDTAALLAAEQRAAAVPARMLELCRQQVGSLQTFRSLCNPQLLSDVDVAIAILTGAGRAAASTLFVNPVSARVRDAALAHLAALPGMSAPPPAGAIP
jgi:formiminotetrahydrofolate cyclodeaminase